MPPDVSPPNDSQPLETGRLASRAGSRASLNGEVRRRVHIRGLAVVSGISHLRGAASSTYIETFGVSFGGHCKPPSWSPGTDSFLL
jgi:hypothetical protein